MISSPLQTAIAQSNFWKQLRRHYRGSPSIALCRVPELEYAARLPLSGVSLDHCCGDGLFASLAWPGKRFSAGCDFDAAAVGRCRSRGCHDAVEICDVSARLPYADAMFDLVFNNSAFEHVFELQEALREVARVTTPGGVLAFNVLNHRYFDWWPQQAAPAQDYRAWQPFFHALSRCEWSEKLAAVGFTVETIADYFPQQTARELAILDSEFSGCALRNRPSPLVSQFRNMSRLRRWWWWRQLGKLPWVSGPDLGAGYFITARRG